MKDYATEELGVTGGEWKVKSEPFEPLEIWNDVPMYMDGFPDEAHYTFVARGHQYNPEGSSSVPIPVLDNLDRQWEADFALLAASKDLYNVLRKVEGQATPCEILTWDGYRDVYSVPLELIDEVKALLARLREATK